jgi:hypothetical protein
LTIEIEKTCSTAYPVTCKSGSFVMSKELILAVIIALIAGMTEGVLSIAVRAGYETINVTAPEKLACPSPGGDIPEISGTATSEHTASGSSAGLGLLSEPN